MAIINKNKETAELLIKLFTCRREDKSFQVQYIKSILNISELELNLILRNLYMRKRGKTFFLQVRDDKLYLCTENENVIQFLDKYRNGLEFDLSKANIFDSIYKFEKEYYSSQRSTINE